MTLDPTGVDDFAGRPPRLGLVVPKRHARRAVTRTLLKRQMRAAMQRHGTATHGWWVVRLRQPFPVAMFPSAASDALRRVVAIELDALFLAALRKLASMQPSAAALPMVGASGGTEGKA